MKILISSKYAGAALQLFVSENMNILSIAANKDEGIIRIIGSTNTCELYCVVIVEGIIDRPYFRMDWLSQSLNKIDDQPAVIEFISQKLVNLILQY